VIDQYYTQVNFPINAEMRLNIFNLISYGQLQLPLVEYSITVDFMLKDDITDSTI